MTVFKLLGISMLACSMALILRAYRPELMVPFLLGAGAALLLMALSLFTDVIETIRGAFARLGIDMQYVQVALKVIGIAYLVQFASNICRDAGESALAGKVEMVGRILILSVSVPVILGILEILQRFAGAAQ